MLTISETAVDLGYNPNLNQLSPNQKNKLTVAGVLGDTLAGHHCSATTASMSALFVPEIRILIPMHAAHFHDPMLNISTTTPHFVRCAAACHGLPGTLHNPA